MASANSVTTNYRRIGLAQITSGVISAIPKITHIAIGDGGVDAEGDPVPPGESQTSLLHETARYAVSSPTFPVETTTRYSITIPKTEMSGAKINELALVDADGGLCAIKTMFTKQKDDDVIFTFDFDDEF